MSEWFGYVPQECFLFTGTIRDNIAKGNSGASDEEILTASKRAGLHEYIIDFPDGYGTEVGEAGQRLSGGMRQRLTIARGLLGDPPILILDEPSSNLDRSGEAELAETLETLAQDHTVLLITYSPGLLAVCRQVLIMQKGRIVRSGRPIDVVPQLVAGQMPAPLLREQA
jgi:ATP-binding cassette subfamily C protein LapB